MKILNKITRGFLFVLFASSVSSCALGAASAATAGYSLKAQPADSLTADAEQRIVERTKREVLAELTNSSAATDCQ